MSQLQLTDIEIEALLRREYDIPPSFKKCGFADFVAFIPEKACITEVSYGIYFSNVRLRQIGEFLYIAAAAEPTGVSHILSREPLQHIHQPNLLLERAEAPTFEDTRSYEAIHYQAPAGMYMHALNSGQIIWTEDGLYQLENNNHLHFLNAIEERIAKLHEQQADARRQFAWLVSKYQCQIIMPQIAIPGQMMNRLREGAMRNQGWLYDGALEPFMLCDGQVRYILRESRDEALLIIDNPACSMFFYPDIPPILSETEWRVYSLPGGTVTRFGDMEFISI